MTLLLDTHILLWAADGDPKLPKAAIGLILDPDNEVAFSAASIWEVAIKGSLGRADFTVNPGNLRSKLLDGGYREIAVTGEHAAATSGLPRLHTDPFDRILIAQALHEGCTLLTGDEQVARYAGPVMRV